MKEVGKTTRPFRYDLNQIPYDYTVEVRNRFKGLDLIDRVPDEIWTEIHSTGDRDQDHPHRKEMQKAKWLSELNSPTPIHFSSLTSKMLTFSLAICCLIMCMLP